MKKTFISAFALVSIGLTGCEKECSSSCGTIANDGIDLNTNCYWLEVRNECSGNKKKFCFDEDVWMENYVGEHFCVSGVAPW
jgi:hypothetical protein